MAPAFVMMAIGLAVFPTVAGFNEVLFAVSSLRLRLGSSTRWSPTGYRALTHEARAWNSASSRRLVSLGLSVGSAAAGLLFGFPSLGGAAFLAAAAAMGLAAIASLKLPQRPPPPLGTAEPMPFPGGGAPAPR
ncbi:hypothetical protein [Mesorhizobium onobrychidis]|uniref:hypothetical protein n=1 Tax=Mesorhizobium onobrychidis TaxID=2775404 RepID=UPI00215812A0|nr:hypothetical protein [Mesorhizobium onobrychidis]